MGCHVRTVNDTRQDDPGQDDEVERGSPTDETRGTDSLSPEQSTRRVAIGGTEACDHPEEALFSLGLGGILAFRTCANCEAVVVADFAG